MRLLLDTNVLLRVAQRNDPLHEATRSALVRLVEGGAELCICAQNAVEFWVVLTRPAAANGLGLSSKQTAQEVERLLESYTLLPDPPDLLLSWLALCTTYEVQGRQAYDARLVALMVTHGVGRIVTWDRRDFSRYVEIATLLPSEA